jgi:outer membrane receptor protein involved in Fe transport
VRARGFEASVGRRWAAALIRVHYAAVHLEAPALTMLSKYVLEYARHQSGGSVTLPVGAGFRFGVNVDHRHRRDGQSYDLVSARVGKTFGRVDLSIDGTNLLDARYHEVVGVDMPGRWLMIGLGVR